MAHDFRHNRKSVISIFDPDGGFYVRFDNHVFVQHLGGNEGGRRGDKELQTLFV